MLNDEPHVVQPEPEPVAYGSTPPPAPPRGDQPRSSLPIAALVIIILAAGIATAAVTAAFVTNSQNTAAKTGATPAASVAASGKPGAAQSLVPLTTIYKQASPGVVTISTEARRFGRAGQGIGSGVVADMKGDIVTNSHVIAGAQQIQVTFSDGTTVPGTVVTNDAADDLAIVNVSVAAAKLHPIPFGNSDTVLIGDSVAAIGAPFDLSGTLTEGIVSGLHRSNPGAGSQGISAHDLIQTDAPINPGNSGGPLLNTLGKVIGINESIDSPINGNVGVGFAVPINQVLKLLPNAGGSPNQ
jgi:putative serine protease PepD